MTLVWIARGARRSLSRALSHELRPAAASVPYRGVEEGALLRE